MKTKQTKIDRSAAKWLPGAMALAATTASSQAATVQITLAGNKISSTGGNQLNADLTGDTIADLVFAFSALVGPGGVKAYVAKPGGGADGIGAEFVQSSPNFSYKADARFSNGVGVKSDSGPSVQSVSYLNPVTFSDSRINGGSPTGGWLQVNAFNTSASNHTMEFSRLIFDASSTTRPGFASIPGAQTEWGAVPEPSSLGLLALGAGGLLTRRRREKAAA